MKTGQMVILGIIGFFILRMAMEMRPSQFIMFMVPVAAISFIIAWRKGVFEKDDLELE